LSEDDMRSLLRKSEQDTVSATATDEDTEDALTTGDEFEDAAR
jgi:hypothetical protein